MKYFTILFSIVFCVQCKAQTNSYCLGSSSLFMNNDSLFAAVSIAEPLIKTIKALNHYSTQGFLQVDLENSNTEIRYLAGAETIVYPNPFTQEIQVSSTIDFKSYCLYDAYGKLLDSNAYSTVINLEHFNPSTYLLVLYSENKQIIRTFKILKLY
jgi:hypothetical protein